MPDYRGVRSVTTMCTRLLIARRALSVRRTLQLFFRIVTLRIVYTLYRRRASAIPRSVGDRQQPFVAFTGSGLLIFYYHGVATYIRDHFYVDDLKLSAISGGTSTVLALAMGLDLYQVLLLGLHQQRWILKNGLYLNSFDKISRFMEAQLRKLGVTDKHVQLAANRQCCYIGVTQCMPPRHRSMPLPTTLRDLSDLLLCSCNVMPFFSTPGRFQGRFYVDGGFSAVWSVPPGQPWSEVVKVTCVSPWASAASLARADVQPAWSMPIPMLTIVPWQRQQALIRMGYEDARSKHSMFIAKGLRPLPNAPLTPWTVWEKLFAAVDEDNLPPLSPLPSTQKIAPGPESARYADLLRTSSYDGPNLLELAGQPGRRGFRLTRKAEEVSPRKSSDSDSNLTLMTEDFAVMQAWDPLP